MSNLVGKMNCPSCGKDLWKLVNWETYISVQCVNCLYKIGEATRTDGESKCQR